MKTLSDMQMAEVASLSLDTADPEADKVWDYANTLLWFGLITYFHFPVEAEALSDYEN